MLAGFAAVLGFDGSASAQTASDDDDRFEIVLPDLSDPAMGVYEVSAHLSSGIYENDVDNLIQAADAGDAKAQTALAAFSILDPRGYFKTSVSAEQGGQWADRACQTGIVLACLISDYRKARYDVPFSKEEKENARARLSRRCDQEIPYACSLYAHGQYSGDGTFNSDPKTALSKFEALCDSGATDSCSFAGALYNEGVSGPRDVAKAAVYWARACEKGALVNCVWAMRAARVAFGEDRKRAVQEGEFPSYFKENIAYPWKFWSDAGFAKGELNQLAIGSANFLGVDNSGNTIMAKRAWPGGDARLQIMMALLLRSLDDDPSAILASEIQGSQACQGLDFEACLNRLKTLFQGTINPEVDPPNWAAFSAYCDEGVSLACSMLEFESSAEGVLSASEEAKLAAFVAACRRDDKPNVLACQLAIQQSTNLGRTDPNYYVVGLDIEKEICGQIELRPYTCHPTFSKNPFHPIRIAIAVELRDFAALEKAISFGIPMSARVYDLDTKSRTWTDFVAQSIFDGDREMVTFFAERLNLDAYRVGEFSLWHYAMPTRLGARDGEKLYYRNSDRSGQQSMALKLPVHEQEFRLGVRGFKLTTEQSIERIEMLLDLGMSPDVGGTDMSVYDLYDEQTAQHRTFLANLDRRNAETYQEVESRKEQERRRIANKRENRRAMNDAILRGVQQGLSEGIGRMNSENRRNSSYGQLQEKHRAMAESYRARSSNLTLRTYSAPDTSQFEREQRERQRAQNAQNRAAIEEQRRKNAEFRRQNPQYYGPRETDECMSSGPYDGISGTACPL
jgi:TPR repeat protein